MFHKLKQWLAKPIRKVRLKRARRKRSIRFDAQLLKNEFRVDYWIKEINNTKIGVRFDPYTVQAGLKLFKNYDKQLQEQLKKMTPSNARAIIEEKKKKIQKYIKFLEEEKKKK